MKSVSLVGHVFRNLSLNELSHENKLGNFTSMFIFLEFQTRGSGRLSPRLIIEETPTPRWRWIGVQLVWDLPGNYGGRGAWTKGRQEVSFEPSLMSFRCHCSALWKPKGHTDYHATTCWVKCVPLAGKKCVGLECHIKALKLALLSKLTQTQNKSNCVIYLIAEENVVLFLWV